MINIQTTGERKRKSERLTKEEHKALMLFVRSHLTILDAAEIIGIHRNVLDLVMIKGKGSPETIGKIRVALESQVRA